MWALWELRVRRKAARGRRAYAVGIQGYLNTCCFREWVGMLKPRAPCMSGKYYAT